MFNFDSTPNSASNPADKNLVVVFYATGEGQTLPVGVDGKPSIDPIPTPVLPVSVTIGGQPADILYYGGVPTVVAGVMQVNARVPPGAASGSAIPVVLKVGTFASQSGVTMAIR